MTYRGVVLRKFSVGLQLYRGSPWKPFLGGRSPLEIAAYIESNVHLLKALANNPFDKNSH